MYQNSYLLINSSQDLNEKIPHHILNEVPLYKSVDFDKSSLIVVAGGGAPVVGIHYRLFEEVDDTYTLYVNYYIENSEGEEIEDVISGVVTEKIPTGVTIHILSNIEFE